MDVQDRIQQLKNKLYSEGFEIQLDVKFDGEINKIEYYEVVNSITDVSHLLKVRLSGADELDWLEGQLNNWNEKIKDWIVEHSFSDRAAINERYGF